ncbi:hypothetical protein E4N70_11515 [Treponema vincentii]|uniref:hypothetical protein n=1 Tax=Treponema vincentii TaxID=69710 RepID=UPI0020A2E373|nr:hypothetical protein [Treponema vincentii]UTC47184.1 hypothetical protein E4N72_11945 [Treponema vincentii]UTC60005.1 hypothetical protein E4N70_11515 [Treponema vincentii]
MIRQAYFYEGEDHIDDEYIKTIARRCASCARDFGCSYCTNCQFNPAQFVEFNRAKMLRTAFYIKNQERIGYHSKPSAGEHSEPSRGEAFFKFLALCAGLLIIILAVKNNIDTTRYPYSAPASTYNKQVQSIKKGKSNTSLKNVEREVQRVLYKVHDNIRDVNRDGEINCQDYCLLFCDYYSTAQIVYNKYIGDSGHVFIRVHTDDGWLYIEPQNTNNYYARNAWYKDIYPTVKEYNKVVPLEWIQ